MRAFITILACLIFILQLQAQFPGGNRDGYAMDHFGPVLANDQTFYCSGGNRDGYDGESFIAGAIYNQSAYCSGGDGDGYGKSSFFLGRFYRKFIA